MITNNLVEGSDSIHYVKAKGAHSPKIEPGLISNVLQLNGEGHTFYHDCPVLVLRFQQTSQLEC